MAGPAREGNLEAPTRHPLTGGTRILCRGILVQGLERVFDICHGCAAASACAGHSHPVRSGWTSPNPWKGRCK